jgi:hypothetical protein
MNIALPLKQMTIEDKLRTMEDLYRHADQVQLPAWHSDILAERERNILAGEASFEDWDTAKKRSKCWSAWSALNCAILGHAMHLRLPSRQILFER